MVDKSSFKLGRCSNTCQRVIISNVSLMSDREEATAKPFFLHNSRALAEGSTPEICLSSNTERKAPSPQPISRTEPNELWCLSSNLLLFLFLRTLAMEYR